MTDAAPHLRAFLGVGSNLGRREAYLAAAAARLAARGARVRGTSAVYETRPVGVAGSQPDFLNAVLEVDWTGTPEELLDLALDIEREYGRERPPDGPDTGTPDGRRRPRRSLSRDVPKRYAARPLDLDILLAFGADGRPIRRAGPGLTLPHPRMEGRAFVEIPLRELGVPVGEAPAADPGVRRWGDFPSWLPDEYTEATVAAVSRLRRLGTAWRFLARTESTNEDARAWASEGAPHGAVVIADAQTKGRGRMGRAWATPSGAALALSVVLRPAWEHDRLSLLPLATGVAVARAAERKAAVRAGLKWPNDVVVNGRKLAGILAEVVGESAPGGVAVALGIGVNLNWPAELMPPALAVKATSLLRETGGPVSRPAFARALLEELDQACDELDRDPAAVLDEWRRRSLTLGREIVVAHGRDLIHGRALDVAPDGGLVVGTATGKRTLHAGEVTLSPFS